jgi:hypothetical protein
MVFARTGRPRASLIGPGAVLGLFVGLCGCAAPLAVADGPVGGGEASYAPGTIVVQAGKATPLTPVFMSMTTSCRSLPRPRLEVSESPRIGSIAFARGTGEATFGPGPYVQCRGRRGDASVVFYTAPDRPGARDHFTVHVTHHDGSEVWVPFDVVIRP